MSNTKPTIPIDGYTYKDGLIEGYNVGKRHGIMVTALLAAWCFVVYMVCSLR